MPLQDADPTPSFGGFGIRRSAVPLGAAGRSAAAPQPLPWSGLLPRGPASSFLVLFEKVFQLGAYAVVQTVGEPAEEDL